MNDNRYNSSSTEVGVLAAITGSGPTLLLGDTYYQWRGEHNHTIIASPSEAKHRLLIRRLLTYELVMSIRDSKSDRRTKPKMFDL
ncbi:hypothetical protein AVEN_91333-1 [Araneus ventricosus]|uniref:Uncharacterized protein n=1 Tax=Araneus ventricosus TaxID=182803 RepID=A0A4Y2LC26_ARAVE|nr:hypothetical protein AVEN_91333-1 [Araneus ventricosus]